MSTRAGTLAPGVRKAILTVRIIASVALLGDSAGFVAVATRAALTNDPDTARASYEILNMFSVVFGIPLSGLSLVTGVVLGLGTKWGVFRYPWVMTKLLLNLSVMLVGSFVIGPAEQAVSQGSGDAGNLLVAGGAYDVLALGAAVTLSVYKPGRRFSTRRQKGVPHRDEYAAAGRSNPYDLQMKGTR
ncbi:MAG: DUF2269 family protein [Actinomycetota bacterium]